MIQSFGDKDTEQLFKREQNKKLPPALQQRARSKLLIIHAAVTESDLNIPPGNRFEKLKGDKKGWCSMRMKNPVGKPRGIFVGQEIYYTGGAIPQLQFLQPSCEV